MEMETKFTPSWYIRIIVSAIFVLASIALAVYTVVANAVWWIILAIPVFQLAYYWLVPFKVQFVTICIELLAGIVLIIVSIFTFSGAVFLWGLLLTICSSIMTKIGPRDSFGEKADLSGKSPKEIAEMCDKASTPPKKKASVIGRAAVGYVVAGEVGAAVGAISAIKENERNEKKEE